MTNEQRLEQHIETIARWISECEHIVAFTGVGISTDSGIPTFVVPKECGRGVTLAYQRPGGGFRRAR